MQADTGLASVRQCMTAGLASFSMQLLGFEESLIPLALKRKWVAFTYVTGSIYSVRDNAIIRGCVGAHKTLMLQLSLLDKLIFLIIF